MAIDRSTEQEQMDSGGAAMTANFTPRVDMMGMSLKSSTTERAEVDVHFEIKNPHPVPIDLVDVDFTFENEDGNAQQVLVKKVQHPYAIQACSSKVMKVPVNLDYKEITAASSGRIIPCTMRAELSFRQSIFGMFKVSVDKVKHFINVLEHTSDQQQQGEVLPVTGYVNGMHISSLSPTQVGFSIILRVSNGNPIPVQLDKADFTLEGSASAEEEFQELVHKVVIANQSVPGRSQKRIEIPLTVKFDELKSEFLPKPGKLFPFKLKMDFWFKDSSHGAYKISQEKSGSLPLLTAAKVDIKEVIFERDFGGHPEAKMKLQLRSFVPPGFKLTELNYAIKFVDEKNGGEVAVAKLITEDALGMEIVEESLLEVFAEPVQDSAFGSALWDVFSDKDSTFKPVVSVKGYAFEYGQVTM